MCCVQVVEEVLDAVDFAETCGVSGSGSLKAVDLFVGHEGLGLVVTFFKQISIQIVV